MALHLGSGNCTFTEAQYVNSLINIPGQPLSMSLSTCTFQSLISRNSLTPQIFQLGPPGNPGAVSRLVTIKLYNA